MAKTQSLRTEIVVQLTILLGAALLLGGFLLLRLAERELLDQRAASLVASVEIFAKLRGDIAADPSRYAELLQSMSGSAPLDGWVLVDHDLHNLDGSLEPERGELMEARLNAGPVVQVNYPPRLLSVGSVPDYLLVTVPLLSAGQFRGGLQVRFSLSDLRQRMASAQRLVFLYALLYGAVLTATGVFLLHRNVVRPARGLMQVTRRIAAGDLEEKAPEEGPREIVELSVSFNRMTAALRESRRQTDEHIDSLQQANDQLARTRDELVRSEKMASVGHLAAGMAHEIGNPLGALVGYLGVLQAEIPSGRNREIAGRCLAEAERIDRLVRDLLDYAAPGRGEGEDIDPAAVLREAADILKHQGALAGRTVEDKLPPSLPAVRVARHKLLQVGINLLLNARDAGAEGQRIRLDGGMQGNRVWLAVGDGGRGIDPEVLKYIFDPFFTTKPPGQGRGLGLFVCHRIIEEAGGLLEVRSEPGRGSEFMIRLRRTGVDDGA